MDRLALAGWSGRLAGKFHASSSLRRAEIDVFGPFGGFTPFRFEQYERMVWVGTGIGITPFLSMLAFERSTLNFRQIWLYYVARNAEDAVYDQEIPACRSRPSCSIEYVPWLTHEKGRLTAGRIAAEVEHDDYPVMLCGTMPFVDAFVSQFRELGLPRERIITEELQFRPSSGASVMPRGRSGGGSPPDLSSRM